MKSGSPKKAPRVAPPPNKNGNYMREYDDSSKKNKSPMSPMTRKRLSK